MRRAPGRGGRLRVAISEAEWLFAEDLRVRLEDLGCAVVGVAPAAAELVALVARERPDLTLVAVRPTGGGNALGAARAIRRWFGVPALAVSAHLTEDEAAAAGLLGVLPRPVAPGRLREALTAVAAGPGNGRGASGAGGSPTAWK